MCVSCCHEGLHTSSVLLCSHYSMPEFIEVHVFVGLLLGILREYGKLVLQGIAERRRYVVRNSAKDQAWEQSQAVGKVLLKVLQYAKALVLVFDSGVSLVINFGQGAYVTTTTSEDLSSDPVLSAEDGHQCVCVLKFQGYHRLVIIQGCNTSFAAQVIDSAVG